MSTAAVTNTHADLRIDSIAAGGDGIARTEGIVVFVPRAAPGDLARVRLDIRRRFARGTIEEIIEPSPDRVEPPCRHYGIDRCGGCQIQHLAYPAQLEVKRTIVRDALVRIGKRAADAPDIVPSERQWRYRSKLTLAMRRHDGRWTMGLHPYDDPVAVFALQDCPITDERVLATWREIMAASTHLPPSDELRASVRLTEGGVAVVMQGGTHWPARSAFFDAVPSVSELWWKPAHRPRMLVAQRGAAQGGGGGGGGASFAQVNPAVALTLRDYVLERIRALGPSTLVDAYAGSGSTAAPIAAEGVRVTAIEVDADATNRCATLLPEGSRALAGRVEDRLAAALPADVVLLNPPRTGLHERVTDTLQSVSPAPRAVIYVSCDPATLARDLARLPRYRIASLRAFDMFPQTAHVETVCELVPAYP